LLTIAPITVIAIVASQGRILVAVDVGDRRADGNGYENEESCEAAYRPCPRHPRDDDGHTPRTKRFITIGQLIVIFGSCEKRPEIVRPTDRPDCSKATTSRSQQPAYRLGLGSRRRSHCFLIRSIIAQ